MEKRIRNTKKTMLVSFLCSVASIWALFALQSVINPNFIAPFVIASLLVFHASTRQMLDIHQGRPI